MQNKLEIVNCITMRELIHTSESVGGVERRDFSWRMERSSLVLGNQRIMNMGNIINCIVGHKNSRGQGTEPGVTPDRH